jgi:hypothetical protein
MSSVQFISWERPDDLHSSYKALKAHREYRQSQLEHVLRIHSSIDSPKIAEVAVMILDGNTVIVPAKSIDSAEDLVGAFSILGAKAIIREMDNACRCEWCNTFTVIRIAEEPIGFAIYCCAKCNEIKRACPNCDGQGWLRHRVLYSSDYPDLYDCENCNYRCDPDWRQIGAESSSGLWNGITKIVRDFL